MKISVLGCGRWGSFLAWYQATVLNNGVILWGERGRKSYECLKADGKNEYVALDPSITLTDDLALAASSAEVIIVSISAQALRSFLSKVARLDLSGKIFVLCMKGIEEGTGKRLSEVAVECGIDPSRTAVWVGPGHIQAFVKGIPNCMLIDSADERLTRYLADSFKSNLIRFYYGNDLIGTEVGAAAKNVLGIVAGILDGCGYASLKGPLMARGAFEVASLIKAMGGDFSSAYGLAHLGDYETTLFSEYSNNRRYGEMLVNGVRFEKLAEGVMTAKAMSELGEKYGIDLPITKAVCDVCFNADAFAGGDGREQVMQIILKLFERQTKTQFYEK